MKNKVLEDKSMGIRYVEGDATAPTADGQAVIVHICNDIGGWGRGFVVALSNRWPEPEAGYRLWHRTGAFGGAPFQLGQIQVIRVTENLSVCNLIGQHGVRRGNRGSPPIRYDAVRRGLSLLGVLAKKHQVSVHMPRIGCGLAGGTWDLMGPVVSESLGSVDTTVYDFG